MEDNKNSMEDFVDFFGDLFNEKDKEYDSAEVLPVFGKSLTWENPFFLSIT